MTPDEAAEMAASCRKMVQRILIDGYNGSDIDTLLLDVADFIIERSPAPTGEMVMVRERLAACASWIRNYGAETKQEREDIEARILAAVAMLSSSPHPTPEGKGAAERWKPIETAPLDCEIMATSFGAYCEPEKPYAAWFDNKDQQWAREQYEGPNYVARPTHWLCRVPPKEGRNIIESFDKKECLQMFDTPHTAPEGEGARIAELEAACEDAWEWLNVLEDALGDLISPEVPTEAAVAQTRITAEAYFKAKQERRRVSITPDAIKRAAIEECAKVLDAEATVQDGCARYWQNHPCRDDRDEQDYLRHEQESLRTRDLMKMKAAQLRSLSPQETKE